MQRGPKPSAPLDERLREQAQRLRKEAAGTPPGIARDKLIREAGSLEAASQIQEWLRLEDKC